MFSTTDTVVAIATPAGRGAIGVVRLSGPDAQRIGSGLVGRRNPLTPRRATFATLTAGRIRDRVVITSFPAPASYTGDDVVEISAHGSGVVLREIVKGACAAGARLAAPGEFTLRAYLNGKIDLAQAEAVADLIDAVTPLQARVAFDQLNGTLTSAIGAIDVALFDLVARLEASVDFPDEGYHFIEPGSAASVIDVLVREVDTLLFAAARGRVVRDGLQVAIVGRPNVGKSSLFNALVGSHRAIVADQPGTTRDLLTEVVDLGGLRVTLVDTAGLSDSVEPVEQEGVRRAKQADAAASLVLRVFDGSDAASAPDVAAMDDKRSLLVSSKADRPAAWRHERALPVSSVTGEGLDQLVREILRVAWGETLSDEPAISNIRHIQLLQTARESLARAAGAVRSAGGALPEEFLLADLQAARQALEEVTGRRTSDDLLAHVFSRFCVGK